MFLVSSEFTASIFLAPNFSINLCPILVFLRQGIWIIVRIYLTLSQRFIVIAINSIIQLSFRIKIGTRQPRWPIDKNMQIVAPIKGQKSSKSNVVFCSVKQSLKTHPVINGCNVRGFAITNNVIPGNIHRTHQICIIYNASTIKTACGSVRSITKLLKPKKER